MVFRDLVADSGSPVGSTKMEQYSEQDKRDRAKRMYEAFMRNDDDTVYVGNEMGVKGLLVYLAGTYVPYRGEIATKFITFSPRPEKITSATDIVEIVSSGSDSPSLNEVGQRGLHFLRTEFGADRDDPKFASMTDFCMAEEICIGTLPESVLAVPQIGAIEWLVVNRAPELAEVKQLHVRDSTFENLSLVAGN